MEAKIKEMTWHTDKKIIISLITAVVLTMFTSLGQWFYVIKTLDTDPPLIERIIRLEYHASEHGQLNQKILEELALSRRERADFKAEQAKRTTTVYDSQKHMRNRGIHK